MTHPISRPFAAPFAAFKQGLAALTILGLSLMLALPSSASAQELKLPKLNFHALTGLWWAKTLYDDSGEAIWQGGQDDQSVILRVDLQGGFSSRLDCNGLFGQFEAAGEDGSVTVNTEGTMSTLMGCFGDYPPAIRFSDIARFEREDLELRLFDAEGRPIAVLYNVHALHRALAEVLGA